MILLLGFIVLCYVSLLVMLLIGYFKLPEQKAAYPEACTGFSVVIPYRNETENLPSLLNSLQKIEYPREHFQVLLVDDASEDDSLGICRRFKKEHEHLELNLLSCSSYSGAPKKGAIQDAINQAKHPYIITTDADCEVSPLWLREMNQAILTTGAEMISGPVMLKKGEKSLLQKFQEIDLLSLQGATMGGFGLKKPFLCNAANLCFKKESFHEVQGYLGNENIASGDDIFLLEKFTGSRRKVVFLKSKAAIVLTRSQNSLKSLISQRTRWAAKSTAYKRPVAKSVGVLVLLMNFSVLLAFSMMLLNQLDFWVFAALFMLKNLVDFLLIHRSALFFERQDFHWHFLWASCVHPFFTTYVASVSFISGFEWKGREFKK